MGFLAKWLPQIFSLLRLVPQVVSYFEVSRRQTRTRLIAELAHDAVALVALQKGVDPVEAAQLQELIDQLADTLLGQKLVRAKRAKAIAAQAAAGAAAQIGARADLLSQPHE